MNRNLALLTLTGVLTLAACGTSTPANGNTNTGGNTGGTPTPAPTPSPKPVATAILTVGLEGVSQAPLTIKDASGAVMAGYNGAMITTNNAIELPRGRYTVMGGVVAGSRAPAVVNADLRSGNATVKVVYAAVAAAETAVLTIDLEGVPQAPITIKDANGAVVAGYNGAATTDNSTVTLPRGQYTVIAGAVPGFTAETSSVNVDLSNGDGTAKITFAAVPVVTQRGDAYYLDAQGNRQYFKGPVDASKFRFSAWLDGKKPNGIDGSKVGTVGDAGVVSEAERTEYAPLDHQNIVGAYMQYNDNGTWRPVVNAEVDMTIIPEAQQSFPLIRFSAADDQNRDSPPMSAQNITTNGLDSKSWTNADAANEPNPITYPQSAQYPYYNATGVDNPLVPGYTWAALFHDPVAQGFFESGTRDSLFTRVRVIGYVNGQEIEKYFLNKYFVPSAQVSVRKDLILVDRVTKQFIRVLPDDGSVKYLPGTEAALRITVTNSGEAEARNIQMQEAFQSGSRQGYSLGMTPQERARLAASGNNVRLNGSLDLNADNIFADEEFNATLDLEAGETESFTFFATGTNNGLYCDTATITSYINNPDNVTGVGRLDPVGVPATDQACFTVFGQPTVNILKEVIEADDNDNDATNGTTVNGGQNVRIRITVSNDGTQTASNIKVTDRLLDPAQAPYHRIVDLGPAAPGMTGLARAGDGLDFSIPTLGAGQQVVYEYTASGDYRGMDTDNDGTPNPDQYCDVASFTADSITGADGTQTALNGSSQACFTVSMAQLNITKLNDPRQVVSGSTYTSTITVRNVGSADALNVRVRDLIGRNTAGARVEYLNGRYIIRTDENLPFTGERGVDTITGADGDSNPNNNVDSVVTRGMNGELGVTIPAGGFLTLNIVSRIPLASTVGEYCNVASFEAFEGNLVNTIREARACVSILPVSAIQTEFFDDSDNLSAGDSTNFTSVAYNEATSTEALKNHTFSFNVGSAENGAGTEGLFDVSNIVVYYDTDADTDARGGVIFNPLTDTTGTTSVVSPSLYTVEYPDGNMRGSFAIKVNSAFALQPDQAVFVTFTGSTRTDMPVAEYFSSYKWNSVGAISREAKGPATVIESTKISRVANAVP